MRVLHISSGNLYGGVETLLVTLARYRHLCPEMEPHFALSFEGQVSQELQATSVPVYQLGEVHASRPWTIWKARNRLRVLLETTKFHSIICHMTWPLAMFGAAIKGVSPLALWLHNPVDGRHWINRWARRTTPELAICNSQFTALSLPSLFPESRHVTAYYPVGLEQKTVTATTRATVREQMAMQQDGIAILQVSRMESWKGHQIHLQALSRLKDLSNWTAWFVGGAQRPAEQKYLDDLKKSAADLGIGSRVRFLGQRSDIPELLAAADIFCQPNPDPEPFGIVFVEALLAGLPVVSTAIGGAAEIIDSSCGRLVPPSNPEALADTLREMLLSSELRRKMADGGPARARLLCDPRAQLTMIRNALA